MKPSGVFGIIFDYFYAAFARILFADPRTRFEILGNVLTSINQQKVVEIWTDRFMFFKGVVLKMSGYLKGVIDSRNRMCTLGQDVIFLYRNLLESTQKYTIS